MKTQPKRQWGKKPRLPWGAKPSTAGVGLSQLFRADTLVPVGRIPSDEMPTPMLPPPLTAPSAEPRKRKNLPPPVSPPQAKKKTATYATIRCPACNGSTMQDFSRVDVPGYPSNATSKSSDFGMYHFVRCVACLGAGRVSHDDAIAIRAVLARKEPND